MSRAENRSQRQRIICKRRRDLLDRWKDTAKRDPKWLERSAKGKTNPFLVCSCEGCSWSAHIRAQHKRERKAAKLALRGVAA